MRRHVVGYCFPWDVDEGFAVRAVELGVDEVALVTAAFCGARPACVGLGVHVAVTGAAPVPDIGGHARELRWAGADELHVHHLGLAGPAQVPDLRAAVAAWRE